MFFFYNKMNNSLIILIVLAILFLLIGIVLCACAATKKGNFAGTVISGVVMLGGFVGCLVGIGISA